MAERPPADGDVFNPEPRIGWLLRTGRLSRLPGTNVRQFAEMLAEEGVVADASRVSRWETGQAPATYPVIEAYERLTDLDPGGLRAIATFQRRVGSGRTASPAALGPARFHPGSVERLLDAVVDGSPDGRVWLEFAMAASVLGEQLVLPRSLWRTLAARLVRQTSLSVGAAYLGRSEAAILLTTHAAARRAVLSAVGELVTDSEVPITSDPMSLLQEITGEQANALVMRLLTHPHRDVRNAAARVASTKLGRRHFSEVELARLQRIAVRTAREQGLCRDGTFGGLVDLVDMLPGHGGPEMPTTVPVPDQAQVDRVVADVLARSGTTDPMLARMTSLVLADHRLEHRFLASFTLHQSPFRATVAATAAATVRNHLDGSVPVDTELLHRLMVALSVLAGRPEAELLLRLAEDPGSGVQRMALAAFGHLPPGTGVRRPRLDPLLTGPDDGIAASATYCAGMTGDPALRRALEWPDLAQERRVAAQWWVDHGPAVHDRAGSR